MSVTPSPHGASRALRVRQSASELFASMRFAIALLVVLAIASIIGTVIKQDDPFPNYVNQFGPFWADIFRTLGLYNVYGTWWFMLILLFLMVSVSVCVSRNGPKMIADARSWKDGVREGSLRSFGHKDEFAAPRLPRQQAAQALRETLKAAGYRFVERSSPGATLLAAKRGALTKLGYISAHVAIVVICVGGLLDSTLPIKLQMWMLGKSPVVGTQLIGEIGPEHRLSSGNPSFRGYAWVPEGQMVSTAILNDGSNALIQDLPFSIQLNKFIVDYYSTGMPKLFASDIVVIDRSNGHRIPARVEVNKPFTYDGISIYQSSFEDGGTALRLSAYPMQGASAAPRTMNGKVGGTVRLDDGETVELADFRAINVENMVDGSGQNDARGVAKSSLKEAFDERLGSGAKASTPQNLRNIGPSFQYKVRDASGQAREYNNYMVPTTIDGQQVILAGVRTEPDAPFRYLRIPADADGGVKQWMLLRAALQDPALRAAAAHAFAIRSTGGRDATLAHNLEQSAQRVLGLFAGDAPTVPAGAAGQGGIAAIANFIQASVPKDEQEHAAALLMRMLDGVTWDLWQLARERAGQPAAQPDEDGSRFIQASISALSDSFFYGAPVFLHLDGFDQVQASVFQLTRAPGKKIVYLGSLLLVLGIFSMFYIRERRVWFWLKDQAEGGSSVLMAMSSARRTLDFEKEFERLRADARAALGASGAHPANGDSNAAAGGVSDVSDEQNP